MKLMSGATSMASTGLQIMTSAHQGLLRYALHDSVATHNGYSNCQGQTGS